MGGSISIRVIGGLLAGGLTAACGETQHAPRGVSDLYAEASGPITHADADGCVVVHEVWKAQVRAIHETAGLGWEDRADALVEQAYEPFEGFWQGYLGDEDTFRRWIGDLDLTDDPRRGIPLDTDVGELITDVTAEMSRRTGRRACSVWYVVYGPGWTNMGGLGAAGMVVDFFGMPTEGGAESIRAYLPHEVSHVIDGATDDPSDGTLLATMIGEGFASYVTREFYGDEAVSPARALGYTDDEWRWAVEHESELWALARGRLLTRDRDEITAFRSAGARLVEGGPGKIGYFLGFRIVQAYVARHGRESWTELYDLDAAEVLERSGYAVPSSS